MADIKPIFKLKEPNSEAETLIMLKIYFNRDRFVYSTGKKILPKYWNNKTGRPYLKNTDEGLKEKLTKVILQRLNDVNFILNQFADETERIFRHFERDHVTPTTKQIKTEFDKVFNPDSIVEKKVITLNDFIDQYIKDIEVGKLLTVKGERFKLGTIKNYKGFQTQFNEFQLDPRDRTNPKDETAPKEKRKHVKSKNAPKAPKEPKYKRNIIDYKDITIDFYDEFCSFFTLKNYSPNTIGRHIKNLKTIMKYAKECGLHQNTETDRKKFKTINIEVQNIYLTENEVTKLHELDLSNNKNFEVARDIFLIGCYTAQRFSDFATISKKNLLTFDNGTKVLTLNQKKTGAQVFIPIRPQLDEILQKYNYQPPKIFEQQVNSRIKDIGKLAKINATTLIDEIRGGMKVTKEVKKYELIKTHTARRTGCTNMYLAGIPSIDIMKVSGHKTEREFLKYIKVSPEETAQTLSNHPYFNTVLKIAK